MWIARFHQAIPKILEDNPTARFVFLTLTVRNCELTELRSQLDLMNKAWQRLSQRKAFPALGWVKSIEVTRGKDDTAHPHIHAVLVVQSSYFTHGYINQAKWTELWQACLRVDYTPVVNVKAIRPKKSKQSSITNVSDMQDAMLSAIRETLKYSVKPSDLAENQDWLVELTRQLRNSRAVAVGGVLKNYISEQEPEDLIHGDESEPEGVADDQQFYFNWRERVKKYAHRKA
jgi:plasmid rolling circle replication initiator protein Rep